MRHIIYTLILIALVSADAFSQKQVANVDTNYRSSFVYYRAKDEDTREYKVIGNEDKNIHFSLRDTALYSTSPDVFHDIIFHKPFEKTNIAGTTVMKNKTMYDGGEATVAMYYNEEYPKHPWTIYITLAKCHISFGFQCKMVSDSTMIKTYEDHEMYDEKYSRDEVQEFIKKFGPMMEEGG